MLVVVNLRCSIAELNCAGLDRGLRLKNMQATLEKCAGRQAAFIFMNDKVKHSF